MSKELKKFCQQAHEEINAVMAYDDGFHSLDNKDFVALMAKHYFCHQLAMEDVWKNYQETVHNAVFVEEPTTTTNELSVSDAETWVAMVGKQWTLDETTRVAEQYGIKFNHIRPIDFWAALHMVKSDYMHTAERTSDKLDVYVKITKDFLFDEDGYPPKEKLYRYWAYVVKK